jgi:hypothetical protein
MRDRKIYPDSPKENKCVNKIIRKLETLNRGFDWQDDLPDGWYDNLDPLKTVGENMDRLQQLFSDRGVRFKRPIDEGMSARDKKIIETSWISDGLFQVFEEEIKPHKVTAKGHEYLHGRIQILIRRKELIGQKARVTIFIPGAYQILYPPQPSKPNSSITEHIWSRKRETG